MQTRVKTKDEIAAMRDGGRMLAEVLRQIRAFVTPGATGLDVAALAARELKGFGAEASFKGYNGFPDVICISVNDEVVHGIPNDIPFEKGDVVGFDFGVTHRGLITDGAISMFIGKAPSKAAEGLLATTERSLQAGIAVIKDGVCTGDIGAAIQEVLERGGPMPYGIVRELVGHGVGHRVHEDPDIPNYGRAGKGARLRAGMTVAIEPMSTLGHRAVILDSDGWTIRTRDGNLSAHFEHTVLVTEDGVEILTTV